MTAFRSEETLVGLISLAAAGWTLWLLRRAVRDDRLPIGKGEILRAERPGAFRALFLFYAAAAALTGFIALDLIAGLEIGGPR